MQISILIVGNVNLLLASSLYELLIKDDLVNKVGLVDDQETALLKLKTEIFSLVIVLVEYPISGFLEKLNRTVQGGTKVLLVFEAIDTVAALYISRFSVDGLVSTAANYQEVRAAIHTLGKRRLKYISPSLISATTKLFSRELPFAHLSQKELDVATYIMKGKRNTEIAAELKISQKTVSTYKTRIYRKLEVASDVEFLIYAQRLSLLPNQ